MSDIEEFKLRKLVHVLTGEMTHSDKDVLSLWKSHATESLRKYPDAPKPMNNQLLIEFSTNVQQEDINVITNAVRAFIFNYQKDIQKAMLNMLSDIILLQKEVAEYRVRTSVGI